MSIHRGSRDEEEGGAGSAKDVELTVHPGTGHAFMAPHNALGTLDEDAAGVIWPQVLSFLHQQLD